MLLQKGEGHETDEEEEDDDNDEEGAGKGESTWESALEVKCLKQVGLSDPKSKQHILYLIGGM